MFRKRSHRFVYRFKNQNIICTQEVMYKVYDESANRGSHVLNLAAFFPLFKFKMDLWTDY